MTAISTTNMFSHFKNGDINNTIRILTGFSGLSRHDSDAIKYRVLNHATAMRRNVMDGLPIFTNVRPLEAEIETREINSMTSGVLPTPLVGGGASGSGSGAAAALLTIVPDDLHIDNAVLALIMAKEMAFLNRTIQMISLIAARYQEEQADGGHHNDDSDGSESSDNDSDNNDNDDDEPMTPRSSSGSGLLYRAGSHESQNDNHRSDKSQLVATFLVGSGRLQQRFLNLCKLVETSDVLVNGMTTMDRPHTEASFDKQRTAEKYVLSDIYLGFEKYPANNRSRVVWAFLEMRDISASAWGMMSMLAFCNLFRLTAGTDFAMHTPDESIFLQGGSTRRVRHVVMPWQQQDVVESSV
jgi:hypothetical protein